MSVAVPSASITEMVPIEHETSERVVWTMVFALPPAAVLVGGWLAWGGELHWQDLLVLAIMYTLTGLGITVGFHRLFTHRSFKTGRTLRAVLAVLGSMAVEGPVIEWVATHRKHHRFSDHPGDPHSPHLDHAPGWRGVLRGLGHAHVGWMFRGQDMATRPGTPRISSSTATWSSSAVCFRSGCCSGWPSRLVSACIDRLSRRRADRTFVGRRGTGVRLASRDVQHQLAVPLLRPAAVRDQRSVAQSRVAGAARFRGGVA